jgi:hypothetical protein
MTQFPHDEFVKEYLPELYRDYGEVTSSAEIPSERKEIDVFFVPTKPVPTTPETLGLLGKLGQKTCLIEVYRNAIQSEQVRQCLAKLFIVRENQLKKAKGEGEKITIEDLPILWIITPTISQGILTEFTAQPKPDWEPGSIFLRKVYILEL